ncbi:MAG: ABC transporter permease [Clostridia bacterium]|nr:ABC transporter permease [Clostridia bacterium]
MIRYIGKRIAQTVIVMLLVSFITFLLVSVMPKDPVYSLFGSDVTPDEYEVLYKRLGLDQPILVRYGKWLADILRGDLGTSYAYRMPVGEVVGKKIGVTMYMSIVSTLISFPLGMLFGVITAVKRGKWQDNVFTFLANIMGSIPGFVIAIVVLWVFCVQLKWLPSSGFAFPWEDFGTHIRTIIMPMFCLVLGGVAGVTRQTRSSMLEAIRQDYVRTARSKGLKENYIINKHVLRNGLVPIVTLIGGRLAMMIGGSVFIENVFSIPGMGALMVNSVNKVDVPVIQVCVLLTAGCISLSYLFTDFLYLAVDPRISLQ